MSHLKVCVGIVDSVVYYSRRVLLTTAVYNRIYVVYNCMRLHVLLFHSVRSTTLRLLGVLFLFISFIDPDSYNLDYLPVYTAQQTPLVAVTRTWSF